MATVIYWLSFKVSTDRSPSKGVDGVRRQSIYDAVTTFDPGYWEETTSFILFDAEDDIDAVGRAVVAGLDADLDTVVIRKMSTATGRFWEKVTMPTFLRGYVANITRLS